MDDIELEQVVEGTGDWVDTQTQTEISKHPLDCVETEYPHFQYEIESPDAVTEPSARHPVFYGCYDWHSAVHSHWCIVRQLRLFPDHPHRAEMIETIDRGFTAANVEREAEYIEDNPSFEKPYGWAWVLRLAAELALWDGEPADTWATCLEPLESTIRSLAETEFLTQEHPVRVGTHGNSAFALAAILDYARTVGNSSLETATSETARRWYDGDESYPVEYEPLGWDFVSPALTEADLMRRVLEDEAFVDWVDAFFPDLTSTPYERILEPIRIESDAEDGVATHHIGLNISKAWCLAGLADALTDHPVGDLFARSARRHVALGLPHAFTDDYAGAHWLSSFVLYLATRNQGGIL